MDRGEIVARGWKLILEDKRLWGIAALILFGGRVIELALPDDSNSFLNEGVRLLLTALLHGALICMIVACLENRPRTVTEGVKDGWRWLPTLFVLTFILQIPFWGVRLITREAFAINIFDVPKLPQPEARNIALLLILLVSFLCDAILVGVERAAVLESCSVGQALQRGWRLLWTRVGDYWGIGVRLVLIGLAFSLAIILVMTVLDGIISGGAFASPTFELLSLAAAIPNGFIAALAAAAWTLAFREWQAQERSDLAAASKLGSS